MSDHPLSEHDIHLFNQWWGAANYLSIAQIYLLDNPLLREPLKLEHTKPRLLGHWGTTPGLNFIYLHLNRIIREQHHNVMFITGPGHGAPGVVASTYMEGTYSECFPEITEDMGGLKRFVKQFSFPGGIPSHAAATTPGSIHEGGELGYSLSHAYGAAFDNPDLTAACVVGDGEAETGPLAASWHSNKFLNPASDGAVLPILHLNGYKIANPTLLGRMPEEELLQLFRGYGYEPILVEGELPSPMHQKMAVALDHAFARIKEIQHHAREEGATERPTWPMIILRSPKGWTCPKEIDGERVEGFWRSHQVPFADLSNPKHLNALEQWLQSYQPETLFDEDGRLNSEIRALAPEGDLRMSANPHANGGILKRPLKLPSIGDYAVEVKSPGQTNGESTRVLGTWLRDVMANNLKSANFRVFSPDENNSNRLDAVLDASSRAWQEEIFDYDDHLAPGGHVMEILSEHTIQGWLEGYLLTGRHGFFSCYEAFIHIVDSMFNQHAKWLKTANEVEWRRPIASLNYLLTSHVWRQDHNGFSHQDPGFVDYVVGKSPDIVRAYFPPDANTLLCVADHCLRSWNRVNVIVAGKQPQAQWLSMEEAIKHTHQGIGIWHWAGNDQSGEPDVVLACAGDVPTQETLAAVSLLREHAPDIKVRVVNVVDLLTLMSDTQHPHGLSDAEFNAIFTLGKPVIFAYHGNPQLIHRLIYKRQNARNFHVHGFREEGTTTTPFDMTVMNHLDRYHIVLNTLQRIPGMNDQSGYLTQFVRDKLVEHRRYVDEYGVDMPEISDWQWSL
ncbi:phosphoketolase family protein [Carnimonas nigrificans]|uniref:phosphoketolase family protein n=1 Tax=Carnimonas nigrificans TaxID=64323 RepID=UPI000471E31A|nr:phosphoketolase family protein [Carnimonas nigrificans]